MRNRKIAAYLIAILLPLLTTCILYVITLKAQPQKVRVEGNIIDLQTFYLNSEKTYELTGKVFCYDGEILSPYDFENIDRIRGIKRDFGEALLSVTSDDSLVDDTYKSTLHFYIKVPTHEDYAIWFPASFLDYRVYANGVLLRETPGFTGGHSVTPGVVKITLPKADSDIFDIVINIISPTNYTSDYSNAILFGTNKRMDKVSDNTLSTSISIISFIVLTIVFCLIQYLSVRHDKKLISFMLYSVAFLLCCSFIDDTYITMLFPDIPYQIGFIMKGLTTPLFFVALIYHTERSFPEKIPKWLYYTVYSIQVVPLISTLSLNKARFITYLSIIVFFATFLVCEYAFLQAFIDKEKFIIFYIVALSMMESGLILKYLTASFAVPARYVYIYGYLCFTLVEVISLSIKYAEQNAAEQFYKEELARQLANMQASENAFLNAQMKPHFLYNTLNTIADLCVTDSEKAKKLIASLSEYLKLIISLDNMEETVTMRRELELADAYTAIEKERFPTINFYKDFPIRMPAIMMPPLVIQPLIENAIKHGVRKLDKPGIVTLKIIDSLDSVTFEVSDNGVGMTEEQIQKLLEVPKENKSIGIYNIDKRLKNQYSVGLKVESTVGLGTCVSFTIPKF